MKIHFDGVNPESRSGPNSFAMRLAKRLMLSGHELDFDSGRNSDVSLVFIEPSGAWLARKTVQRLDGIWSKASEIETKNKHIKKLYHQADGIVYQSQFDANYIQSLWGHPARAGIFRIINNGIEIQPEHENLSGYSFQQLRLELDVIFTCSANWHRQKRLKENVECFKHLQTIYPKSCLIVLGSNPDWGVADPAIFYGGSLTHEAVLEVFKNSDWMINLEYFSHSPNAVVEALSVGCPVICVDMGGCAELVQDYGVKVQSTDHYPVIGSRGPAIEYDNPPPLKNHQRIESLPDRSELGAHADIDIISCAKKYEELFDKIIRS